MQVSPAGGCTPTRAATPLGRKDLTFPTPLSTAATDAGRSRRSPASAHRPAGTRSPAARSSSSEPPVSTLARLLAAVPRHGRPEARDVRASRADPPGERRHDRSADGCHEGEDRRGAPEARGDGQEGPGQDGGGTTTQGGLMAFRWFKTLKAGPLNVTVSRSGLSASLGGKSGRIGSRPRRRGLRSSVKLPGGWRLRKG